MEEITRISVAPDTFGTRWGVVVNDYQYAGGTWVDFETLLVNMSKSRATTIEGEITPLSNVVRQRNAQLQKMGDALADLQGAQAFFKDGTEGGKKLSDMGTGTRLLAATVEVLTSLGLTGFDSDITRQKLEQGIQLVKSKIDRLNNDAQTDLTRLQSLVDKRDESYNTGSSVMSEVSGTRSNAIRNM